MDKIISPIKQRMLQFLEYEGIKKEEFYLKTGIHSSNFKGVGAKSELGGDKIAKILFTYDKLNAIWLVTGKGRMHRKSELIETRGVNVVGEIESRKYITVNQIVSECVACKTKDKFIELLQNENKAIKEVNELLKEKLALLQNGQVTNVTVDIDSKKKLREVGQVFGSGKAIL